MPVVANIFQPLNDVEEWVLESLHHIGLTWGLAIVGLTLLTRMLTLPLVVRQFRSQREMKLHMPELKRMQKEHKGDKQRLQQEMELRRAEIAKKRPTWMLAVTGTMGRFVSCAR